jgi:membrane protein
LTDRPGVAAGFELPPPLVRWPVTIALVFGALTLVYTIGTGVAQSPRWVVPGAALATVAWLVVVEGFEIYLRFVDPGSAYGAVGSVVVFLFFLYVSSLVFIGGAMVTAVLGRHFDARAMADIAEQAWASGICPPPENGATKRDLEKIRD